MTILVLPHTQCNRKQTLKAILIAKPTLRAHQELHRTLADDTRNSVESILAEGDAGTRSRSNVNAAHTRNHELK